MMPRQSSLFLLAVSIIICVLMPEVASAKDYVGKPQVKCRMTFDIKSWSVFYKSGKGQGHIHCSNGQNSAIKIRSHGGGITFGKSRISGDGSFSQVHDISQLYGKYVQTEAHAGAAKSTGAQAMTKGDISLSLSGKGHGFDLGFAFGSFKIKPVH